MSEQKKEILVMTLVGVALLFFVSIVLLADEPAPATQANPQTKCPVMGGQIDKTLYVDVKGYRIFVCCAACEPKVKADPDKYIAQIKANGEQPMVLPTVKPEARKPADMKAMEQCPACGLMTTGPEQCKMTTGSGEKMKGVAPAKADRTPIIDTAALSVLLESGVPVTLLDARMGKSDDGRRIPGAVALDPKVSAEQAAKAIKTKDALIVAYCTNVKCQASEVLAEHLKALGYTHVLRYEKGIETWVESGHKVEQAKK